MQVRPIGHARGPGPVSYTHLDVYKRQGYFIGGRWADRRPQSGTFYGLVTAAGFCAVFFLLLTGAVLRRAAAAMAVLNVSAIGGSLLLVVLALVVPVTLLGLSLIHI